MTQPELDALTKAYNSGVVEVTFENRTVRYRSLADMRTLIQQGTADINAASGTVARPIRQVRVYGTKGLDGGPGEPQF